jgi:hypothetical protein
VPPTPKPTPKPHVCVTLTVTPKVIRANGKPTTISVKVTASKKAVKGVKVLVTGQGIRATARTNSSGMVFIKVNTSAPGLLRVTTVSRKACGARQIGIVGIFLPPVTG